MEELKIVKYIREYGLEQTIKRFDLIHRISDNRILLKYNQLASYTMFTNKEVQECRGLILEKDTLRVLSLGFYKFFNNGESNANKIDWESAKILEKLDGSMIQLYEYNGTWYPATTGTISGEGEINNKVGATFSDLFWDIAEKKYGFVTEKLNPNNVYVFELCSPYNIVVKPHKESSITLLTVRNRVTLEEFSRDGAEIVAAILKVPIVKEFNLNTDNVGFLLRTLENMPWSEEGYVVVDKFFNRIKIKNPAYVAVHHLKSKTAEHNIVTIIKSNEVEEFISTFPEREEEVIKLEESYYDLLNKLELTWEELELRKPKNIMPSEKKRYAQAVFEVCEKYGIKEFSDLFFSLATGQANSVKEYIDDMDLKKLWLILSRNKNGKKRNTEFDYNIEIKNRIIKINDKLPDFFMVQLYVNGKPINVNAEPISNYDFWETMLEQSQRALYRIKKNNPNMNFNFNLDFSLSDNKESKFVKYLKETYPDLDIDNILNLFDEEIKQIKPIGPDDNHPNPEIRYPIDSDLIKNVFISLFDKLNKK